MNEIFPRSLAVFGAGLVLSAACNRAARNDDDNPRADDEQTTVVEGGMSSGGGMIVGDAGNPWFLENTKKVSYCIQLDDSHFGLSQKLASRAIRGALDKWKIAFSTVNNNYYSTGKLEPFSQVRIGKSSCSFR